MNSNVYLHLFVSQDSETPLIKATKMRNIEIVELLLDKGAKVSAVDKVRFSYTYIHVAKMISSTSLCLI